MGSVYCGVVNIVPYPTYKLTLIRGTENLEVCSLEFKQENLKVRIILKVINHAASYSFFTSLMQGASNPAAGGEWRTWGHIWCLCHRPHLGLPFPAKVFHMALEHSSASFLQWVRLKVDSNYFTSNALCKLAKNNATKKKGQCSLIFFFKWSMDIATLPEQDGESGTV